MPRIRNDTEPTVNVIYEDVDGDEVFNLERASTATSDSNLDKLQISKENDSRAVSAFDLPGYKGRKEHQRSQETIKGQLDQLVRFRRKLGERTQAIRDELAKTIKQPKESEEDVDDLTLADGTVIIEQEPVFDPSRSRSTMAVTPMPAGTTGPTSWQADHGQQGESAFGFRYFKQNGTIEPTSVCLLLQNTVPFTWARVQFMYLGWLFLLSMGFQYNFWAIFLRAAFPFYQDASPGLLAAWLLFDYIFDLLYVVDIIVVKSRLTYHEHGELVTNLKEIRWRYVKSATFKLDLLSLLPLDIIFYGVIGVQPLLRLPRLINIRSWWNFNHRMHRVIPKPEIYEVVTTLIYVFMITHIYTCVFYWLSELEGFGSDSFVFEGKPWDPYMRCFFIAFRMVGKKGTKEPDPRELSTTRERGLMIFGWLIAAFVEIILIAQVHELFLMMTREEDEFRRLMGTALEYVRRWSCPKSLERKVHDWFVYNRETHHMFDEHRVLEILPRHLRTDMALEIHYATLSKVTLFANCDRTVLTDILLKLKPVLFLPGDMICTKGEVGKEMYILTKGQTEVVAEDGRVLAVMTEGAVFGEISLLAVGGGNRRTANVRSKGFSNLFLLNKDDFEEIMRHYPRIFRSLKKKAADLLAKKPPPPPPSKTPDAISLALRRSTPGLRPSSKAAKAVSQVPTVVAAPKPERTGTPKFLKLLQAVWPKRMALRQLFRVHPLPSKSSDVEQSSVASEVELGPIDEAELRQLTWSSPSPDNFYMFDDWELDMHENAVKGKSESQYATKASNSKTGSVISTKPSTSNTSSKPPSIKPAISAAKPPIKPASNMPLVHMTTGLKEYGNAAAYATATDDEFLDEPINLQQTEMLQPHDDLTRYIVNGSRRSFSSAM